MEKDFLMIYSPLQLASSFPSNVNTRLLPEDSHLHHKDAAPWGLTLGYHFVSSGSNYLVRFAKHPRQTITGGSFWMVRGMAVTVMLHLRVSLSVPPNTSTALDITGKPLDMGLIV